MKSFNVIAYDVNGREFEPYDVMPHLMNRYASTVKSRKPVTFDEFKNFVKSEGMHQWWSRCEYEVILSDWPPSGKEEKIDVWWQIEMNLDLITEILMENVKKSKKTKARE